MLTSLKRGALSGLLAGILTAAFGYLLAEPLMDRAVDLEAARAAALGETGTETFTRSEQHFGFLGAAVVVGLAFGVLYGVVHHLVHRHGGSWRTALQLGGGAFFGLALVPWIRYPANPPGVGDSGTIDTRTGLWELSLVLGLAGAAAAALIARDLRSRRTSPPVVQLAVVGVLVATVALTFVLPGNSDEVSAPVDLVWEFRLLSLASLALLWGALSATFGLLSERTPKVARALAQV